RLPEQRARDLDTPLVPVREVGGRTARVGRETEVVEQLPHARGAVARALVEGPRLDVLAHGEVAEEPQVLEGPQQPRARTTRPRRTRAPTRFDAQCWTGSRRWSSP